MARGLELAIRCVCAIEGAGSRNGTGVLIGVDLVLTNHHVVDSLIATRDFSSAECRFDYIDAGDGRGAQAGQTFGIKEVVAFSPPSPGDIDGSDRFLPDHLDYAIVRLDQPVGRLPCGENATRGWITLEERPPAPQIGAPIYILQHPGGRGWLRDQQALRCSSGDLLNDIAGGARVLHDAKTLEGSSGSPCFEEDGFRFIALHNARSGDPQGEGRRAVPLDRIVSHIRETCDIAHRFVGLSAPQPAPGGDRKLAQLRAKAAEDRKQAALVLMDRTSEESRFLTLLNAAGGSPSAAPKPLLNVIVSRRGDAPNFFLDRLRYLSFSFPPASKTASWLGALRKGLADPTRAVSFAAWPDIGDPDERRQELEGRLYALDPGGRHLLMLQRSIYADWIEADEHELLSHFASRLAETFADNPDGVQCVALAARFAAMWKATNAPQHCGFCVRLRDIACDDLVEWRDFLDNAWGKNAAFQAAVDGLFAVQAKQPLGHVAHALDGGLMRYIEEVLNVSRWAPESLT
jgi:hypothetical protein